jgi:hypothetical protein
MGKGKHLLQFVCWIQYTAVSQRLTIIMLDEMEL